MSFDDELEGLEAEAYTVLKTVPREELTRQIAFRSGEAQSPPGEASAAIGAVIDFKEHRRADALEWARDFVFRFLSQIQAEICANPNHDLGEVAGVTPQTAASAVAAWVVASFGVASPIAFAIATLVVLVLARALKGAFCGMADEEIKHALQPGG